MGTIGADLNVLRKEEIVCIVVYTGAKLIFLNTEVSDHGGAHIITVV